MMLDLREADDRLGTHDDARSGGSWRPARRAWRRSICRKLTTGSARTATIELREADDPLGPHGHDRSAGS